MTRRTRRNHTAAFKAKVAMAALKGDKTLTELARAFDVRANQIARWKNQLQEGAAGVFGPGSRSLEPNPPAVDIKTLRAKIGELTLENDFLEGALDPGRHAERKTMIDREHELPIAKRAVVLNIGRGSVYCLPRPAPERDLKPMRRIGELHMDRPFAGARMLAFPLAQEGLAVGRKHVGSLMRKMGIEALYRGPRTSRPEPGHKAYPHLLKDKEITRANQVRAMDITCIPMAKGYCHLAAVMDGFTRKVLAWRLPITMEASFRIEAVEEALETHGRPEIFNTDQGSQFTGQAFTGLLARHGIAISMDGKGAWRDNAFVERLWRSVKYEEVYLKAYASVSEARASLARCFTFHNTRRPHQALDGGPPDRAYFTPQQLPAAA
jgi:putative transposase